MMKGFIDMPLLEKDKEILLSQSNSKTLAEWADFFDGRYSKKQIYDFCYSHGVKPKKISDAQKSIIQSKNARKYRINQDYFKTWSHNMAYILGLWFADGCIYRGQMFDITLHKKDKYILKKIANEIGYKGHFYDCVDRQAARINFSCVVIYNDIVALGGGENKSMTIKFPEIPENYLHDFVRGYFDGNGSVMFMKNNRINSAFTCGSKDFLMVLWEKLRKYAGVEGGSYDQSCYSLKFGKKDTYRIGALMYKDNPDFFLKRKREKFGV